MSVTTTKLEKIEKQLLKLQRQYVSFSRKKLGLALKGGRLLIALKKEVKEQGRGWLEWLGSDEGKQIIKMSVSTCENWMHVAKHWDAIEAMLDDNPDLIVDDLGLEKTLELLRLWRQQPDRVKSLTPDDAQELIREPAKPQAPGRDNDTTDLLPLPEYRIQCCSVAELGTLAGLQPDSLDLAFADPPWGKDSLDQYRDIARFAQTYLKTGRPLLCHTGGQNLPDILDQLRAEGLEYVHELCILFPNMHAQTKLNGRKLRNGCGYILMFSKGRYEARCWMDDSQDGLGSGNSEEESMYWIQHLTMPGELVASLCGGVFSEAIACRRLGRRFVGCDPSERKCQIGSKRLEEVTGLHRGALYTRWRG